MTYLVFVLSALLNYEKLSMQNWSHALQLCIVIYIVLNFFCLPLFVLFFYGRKYAKMDEPSFKQRWGSIYAGFKEGEFRSKGAVLYPVFFYVRRLLFALLCVYLTENWVLQIYL